MVNTIKKDVIIVGAGPCGSQLAFRLAQRGYDVLVVDKRAAAGEEICCTGIVSRQCLEDFALDRSLILRPAGSARFVAPSGEWLRLWRDSAVAYILDRPVLDVLLVDRARQAGAAFIFAAPVTDIHIETDRVRVKAVCGGEEVVFEARAAVLATGFGSSLPGRLGLGNIRDFTTGVQAGVEIREVDEVEVYFDRTLAPGGFAWLVPTAEGRGLAGLLTRRDPQLCVNNLLSRLETRGKIVSAAVSSRFAAIPLRTLPRTVTDRLLAVGEVAGQVKPTTGGGIYYGLLCADIAADTLHQAFITGDFSQTSLASYESRWRARLNRELQTGRWLLCFYHRMSNRSLEYFFRVMRSNNVPQFLAGLDTFSFDEHSAIAMSLLKYLSIKAPSRLTRGLLTAVGIGSRSH